MGQESRRKSFVFYTEWKEVLVDYPPEVRLEVYDAVIEYAESGTLSELRPLAKMAFSFIKKQIDSNKDKYDEQAFGCRRGIGPNIQGLRHIVDANGHIGIEG